MDTSQHIVTLTSLRRLRWLTLLALPLLPVAMQLGWVPTLPVASLVLVFAVPLLGQLALTTWPQGRAGCRAATAVLAMDGLGLTALFATTDGSATPFAFLYLFPVVLAGLALPGWRAAAVGAVCTLGYASLFVIAPANLHHHDHQAMITHMYGMFVAYVLTVVLIVAAMARMTKAQEDANRATLAAQDLQARTQRVASLATLAAGASHELANPLSTILMVAGELHRSAPDERTREDLQLIRDEVARCRTILESLSTETAAGTGRAGDDVAVSTLLHDACTGSPDVTITADDAHVRVPSNLIHQVVRRLVENARQAGAHRIELSGQARDGGLWLTVVDDGSGMDPSTLDRAAEPFFTTRQHGTGLGLYFASQVVEQLGGTLTVQSSPGAGTTIAITVPSTQATP